MIGMYVTGLAFLTGFLAIFGVNLLISDVVLKEQAKSRKRLEEEVVKRHRDRARQALAGRDLDELAAEALRNNTSDDKTFLDKFDEMITQSGTQITMRKLLAICLAVGAAAGLAVGLVAWSIIAGVIIGALFSIAPILFVQRKRAQRLDKLRGQMPDALELMGRILRAGQTTAQALLAVSTEFKAPIGAEFGYCYEQQNLGLNLDTALRDMADRTGLLEVRIFVLGLLIHRRSGGNLTELLDSLASIIRERHKLRGKIKAMTAEGRLQALLLIILPFVAFFGMAIVNRAYAMKLLDHPQLIYGSIVSMALGAVWIRRIVNFEF